MRTLRLLLEYDGTGFAGWQRQAHLDPERTLQGALEVALQRLTQRDVTVRAASRTDAGVHARGQVVAFDTDRHSIPLTGFARGLNTYLPPAIVVRQAEEAVPSFHPRNEARGKRYVYTLWRDAYATALDRHRVWWVPQVLDLEAMGEGGKVLEGSHNFEAFRSAGCGARHARRTVYSVRVLPGPRSEVRIEVLGNAFLRNMVRIIVGNLVEIGLGKRRVESLQALLASGDRTQGGITAPATGLCLEEVIYDHRLPPRP